MLFSPPLPLLAADRRPLGHDLRRTLPVEGRRYGATALRLPCGGAVRADLVAGQPIILRARRDGGFAILEVLGAPETPAAVADQGLAATAGWAGFHDAAEQVAFAAMCAAHPVLAAVHRRLGTPVLSALPRAWEAFGRAVLGQLVQSLEAARSGAQLAAVAGVGPVHPHPARLWAWPDPQGLAATPAWTLRGRCGVSLRGARALHAGVSLAEGMERHLWERDWAGLDHVLRTLPGVGVWTSGEARLALGDPDAVPIGDYHLPEVVGVALGGLEGDGPGGRWSDAGMLDLLAPFAGQRGRAIRLVLSATRTGLLPSRPRRGPRAAVSRHRYW